MKTKTPAVRNVVHSEEAASSAANPPTRAAGELRCVECYLPAPVVCDHQDAIAYVVAAEFKLTTDQIHTRTRATLIAWPRQIAIFLSCQKGYSCTTIARYWDFDHTTVIYARRKVRELMAIYPEVRALVHRLAKSLNIPLASGS